MNANICPLCGKEVMPYKRFLREAEPFKTSACGSCGGKLKRSAKVFPYLIGMMLVAVAIALPTFLAMANTTSSFWILTSAILLSMAGWIVLTNYVAWRIIPWVPAERKDPP